MDPKLNELHSRPGGEAWFSSPQALPQAPEAASRTPRPTRSLAIQCSNWSCLEYDAWPIRDQDGLWISKIWGCNTCGHLFRVHEVYFEGRRCVDIMDREKRI